MNVMVQDIVRPDFNWEQERDQPDFNWEQERDQTTNFDAKAFFELLEHGNKPLWPCCTKQTTLSVVVMLLNIKANHNMSHECFESLLKAFKSMLPGCETLPNNFYFCKKMVISED